MKINNFRRTGDPRTGAECDNSERFGECVVASLEGRGGAPTALATGGSETEDERNHMDAQGTS